MTFASGAVLCSIEGAVGADTESCCPNARIWSERALGVFQQYRREGDIENIGRSHAEADSRSPPRQTFDGEHHGHDQPDTPRSTYNTAIGFPGEPVAPTIGTGAKT